MGDGLYLNPALPEAAAYVVEGVAELVRNYPVDGVHFDDYFYPTTDPAIDAAPFVASGAADLAGWRRQNVTALVKAAHDAVKAADPHPPLWGQPPGQPRQRYGAAVQRRVRLAGRRWRGGRGGLPSAPQIYWGQGYTLSNGSRRFAFENIVPEWLAMPRGRAALYVGLGAYRIGDGDGGAQPGQRLRLVHRPGAGGPGGRPAGRPARADTRCTGTARCSRTAPGPSWLRPSAPAWPPRTPPPVRRPDAENGCMQEENAV